MILFGHKKEGKSCICDTKDEPGGYCAKLNKPEREKLYDFTCMWNLKKKKKSNSESRLVTKAQKVK